jgi:hypothetical protein
MSILSQILTQFREEVAFSDKLLGGCPRTQIFVKSRHKIVEKAQFTCVNEHFETIFNAELAER